MTTASTPAAAIARIDDRGRGQHGPPDRSTAQRMTALAQANRIRTYRKDLKAELKRGHDDAGRRVRVYDVLAQRHHPMLDTMKVYDLLKATPKVSRVKATTILNRARVSPSKTLGGLTDRQVRELTLVLQSFPSLR